MEPLRLGVLSNPPQFYNCAIDSNLSATNGCSYPGIMAEFFYRAFKFYSIPYQLITYNSWQDVMDDIQRGRIDTAAADWYISMERFKKFDILAPVSEMRNVFVTKAKLTSFWDESWAMVKDSWAPWLGLALALFLVIGAIVLPRISTHGKSGRSLLTFFIWFYTSVVIICCAMILPRSLKFGPRKMAPNLNDIMDDLALGKAKMLSFSPANRFLLDVENSEQLVYRKFRDIFAKNPVLYVREIGEAVQMMHKGDFVAVLPFEEAKRLIRIDCSLAMVQSEILPAFQTGLILGKFSKWTPVFAHFLAQNRPYLEKLFDRYDTKLPDFCYFGPYGGARAYGVLTYSGLFGICAFMICFAIVVLFCECCCHKKVASKAIRAPIVISEPLPPPVPVVDPRRETMILLKDTLGPSGEPIDQERLETCRQLVAQIAV